MRVEAERREGERRVRRVLVSEASSSSTTSTTATAPPPPFTSMPSLRLPARIKRTVAVVVAVLVACILLFGPPTSSSSASVRPPSTVAVYDSAGYHDEVAGAFIYSLVRSGRVPDVYSASPSPPVPPLLAVGGGELTPGSCARRPLQSATRASATAWATSSASSTHGPLSAPAKTRLRSRGGSLQTSSSLSS